ncbi:MAG: methyltransferase [Bacteroidales bacterium]
MRKLIIRFIFPFFRSFVNFYFSKPRNYRYKKIKAVVLPGVFFPHFTISTKLLLQFLETKELEHHTFLELGCGTGIISVLAAKKGARVVASDINPTAIENAKLNATKNSVEITTYLSDLFAELPRQQFDFIIINPPYYPKTPKIMAEEAWFCGEHFEYFEKLFLTATNYFHDKSEVLMILSEDCELEKIKTMAAKNGLNMIILVKKKKWGEMNYIFRLFDISKESNILLQSSSVQYKKK